MLDAQKLDSLTLIHKFKGRRLRFYPVIFDMKVYLRKRIVKEVGFKSNLSPSIERRILHE